jgi:hypothetical protein
MGHYKCSNVDFNSLKQLIKDYNADAPMLYLASSFRGVEIAKEGLITDLDINYHDDSNKGIDLETRVGIASRSFLQGVTPLNGTIDLIKTPLYGSEVKLNKRGFVEMFNKLLKVDKKNIVSFVSSYGRLHSAITKNINGLLYVGCDSVDDWVQFVEGIKAFLSDWESVENGKPLDKCTANDEINKMRHLIVDSNILLPRTNRNKHQTDNVYTDDLFFSRILVAIDLQDKLRDTRFITRCKVMPHGQIVTKIYPADLYSLVWGVIQNSVMNTGDILLKKCDICGKYGIKYFGDDTFSIIDEHTDGKRKKTNGVFEVLQRRKDTSISLQYSWYHVLCKDRIRKQELRKKNKGQTFSD